MVADTSKLSTVLGRGVLRELRRQAGTLGPMEARWLVDTYYQVQELRKAAGNRKAAVLRQADAAPPVISEWLAESMWQLEGRIKSLLKAYAQEQEVGAWAMAQIGVGPVISAGLLAHIDIHRAPTAGAIWRFAGLDPTQRWEKGQKRPWNAKLKVICWNLGECFVKCSRHPKCFYGHLYQERKAWEREQNEAGAYAEQAAAVLERSPRHAQRATYAQGRLPDGHIHARAKRWTVKLFLAHWHEVAWWAQFKEPPPTPYVLEHIGGKHVHRIDPPGWERPA